jgi:uncharacterized membrane protein YkvA (DUF1232 family)
MPWIDWPGRRAEEDVLRRMTMPFEQAAAWGQGRFEARGDRDEARVRRDFWRKAARLPFAEDLLAAYYCAFDRATPVQVKATLVGALAYFVLPFDAVPDMLPLVGFTDDAAVLLAALRMVARHMRAEHRDAARAALARMKARRR